jgi:hypothetical protein
MADVEFAQERKRLLAYLTAMFGEDVVHVIEEPSNVQIGERVLYRLAGDRTASRHEPSAEDLDRLRDQMARFANDTGGSVVAIEPPTSSGLSCPRLVDLPGSEIIWDRALREFIASEDRLPALDFPLEWAIGVLQGSEDLFLYLNFTHPKVKAVFRIAYEPVYLRAEDRARLREEFTRFREKERELRDTVEAAPDIAWAKIVQVDMEPASIRIKSLQA